MIAEDFHRNLWTSDHYGPSCSDPMCKILHALVHMEQNVRSDERKYLIPKICKRCDAGQELVRDVKGDYCHRAHVGAYLHDCHAAAIHEISVTPAIQVKET